MDTLLHQDIAELKVIIAKQEANLSNLTAIMGEMKHDLKYHIKRSDTLEELFNSLKQEHELTKQLLISKIDAEKTIQEAKSEVLWTVLKTIFYTLSAVGAVLLALKQLEILDKLF